MSNENGLFVKHTNCPACGSKDNLALYVHETENGDTYSSYCFGGDCGSSFKHEQLIEAGIVKKEDVVDKEASRKNNVRKSQKKNNVRYLLKQVILVSTRMMLRCIET